jgi:hypothetical protein
MKTQCSDVPKYIGKYHCAIQGNQLCMCVLGARDGVQDLAMLGKHSPTELFPEPNLFLKKLPMSSFFNNTTAMSTLWPSALPPLCVITALPSEDLQRFEASAPFLQFFFQSSRGKGNSTT